MPSIVERVALHFGFAEPVRESVDASTAAPRPTIGERIVRVFLCAAWLVTVSLAFASVSTWRAWIIMVIATAAVRLVSSFATPLAARLLPGPTLRRRPALDSLALPLALLGGMGLIRSAWIAFSVAGVVLVTAIAVTIEITAPRETE